MSETKHVHHTSLPTILFVVFLVLKLCHVIDWSWWWVTAPLWIPISIVLFVLLLVVMIAVITRTPIKITRRHK